MAEIEEKEKQRERQALPRYTGEKAVCQRKGEEEKRKNHSLYCGNIYPVDYGGGTLCCA